MTTAPMPLTRYSPGGGCACKLPQRLLDEVLTSVRDGHLAGGTGGILRVGLDPADDAAVVDLPGWEGRSLVVTTDFLTPVVDDPFEWGRIAATNALSDVYAMGGRPLVAVNLLGWPADLDRALLAEVLRGGAAAVTGAGALIVGGHSIVDPAPKYGLAVVGEVAHDAVLRKGGGRAGDRLVLTKRLGLGVVGTAIRRGQAGEAHVRDAVTSMTRLNATAAQVAVAAGLRGGTDVTGYGLIGHLHEMALAAGVAARVRPSAVPLLPGVRELVQAGCAPDGSRRTLRDALAAGWFVPGDLDPTTQLLLADAQTSGGLLLAVPPAGVDQVLGGLRAVGEQHATVVGELVEGVAGQVGIAGDDRAAGLRGTAR
ncbi:selenide, water dikinase SelD [Pseudonocardia hydrocarbonoxydans]|uniref:Selenide, water dikinase n=1 Tax=Pseudonocardia hydrocarbonoxydans TaxID=76726 RepID=A0A4Y3WSR1_9PSEU|nr:selenide, water dikinase SelD [Pseudonocardia hydrocarbonoxydans]GEC21893.1 selenide, water dikinase [Pseudonocardia hydrocarbonoxydans]